MEWIDEGIVLGVKRHGETSVILELMTQAHGRHLGLVRGGAGRRLRGVLQPGNAFSAITRSKVSIYAPVRFCRRRTRFMA